VPFIKRVGELFLACGPVRFLDLSESIAFVKADGAGIPLKHHELQEPMVFFRLVQQSLAKRLSDMGGEEVEMIDPTFPEGAETNKFLFIFKNPNLALREDPVPVELFVSFERVQVGQVRKEALSGFSSDLCDAVGVTKFRLSQN
jgi:hypothetical protein